MDLVGLVGWGARMGVRLFPVALLLLLLPGGDLGAQTGAPARMGVTAGDGLLPGGDLSAQSDAPPLSLGDAVSMALRQSRDIQDARLLLEEAGERVSEAWGSVFPKVDFSGSYTRNIAPAVSFLPAQIFDPTAPEGQLIKVRFGADNAWSSSLVLDQPLFQAQAFIGVGAAGRYKALQEEVLRGRAQGVVTRVRLAYYDLLLAREERRLIQNSVGRVTASLEETEALNRAGLASDYDVLRLQVELANLVPNLRRTENALHQARRQLAMELNLDDPETLEITGGLASMDLENPGANDAANREILALGEGDDLVDVGLEEVLRLSFEERSDLKQLELTEKLRTAELRVQQVEFLPKISLFGNYQINAQQNGSPDFFGDGTSRATSKWVGISVSLPIFTGFQRGARISQSRAVLSQVQNQSAMARLQAESQVKSVREQAEEALERARGQRLAVGQAGRGFEIASAQYREGLSSQLELTDAEVALRQSEYNYAQAVYDYLVFRARLDEAVGRVPMAEGVVSGRPGSR